VNFDSNHTSRNERGEEHGLGWSHIKAAIWQDDHWVDRSVLFKAEPVASVVTDAVKIVRGSLSCLNTFKFWKS